MRNYIVILLTLFLILSSCEKKSDSVKSISVQNVNYSGCFNSKDGLLKSTSMWVDSLYYTTEGITLNLFINIIYPCCGNLKDSVLINDNVMSIYLVDKNPYSNACNCLCPYTIKYSISNYENKNIDFRVYKKNYAGNDFSLWKETWYISGSN